MSNFERMSEKGGNHLFVYITSPYFFISCVVKKCDKAQYLTTGVCLLSENGDVVIFYRQGEKNGKSPKTAKNGHFRAFCYLSL